MGIILLIFLVHLSIYNNYATEIGIRVYTCITRLKIQKMCYKLLKYNITHVNSIKVYSSYDVTKTSYGPNRDKQKWDGRIHEQNEGWTDAPQLDNN